VTADGERYDPARPAASHQTLQLPVILRVRNLENGREITLRVNDRGPASPGRLLSVTPRAAQLLGMVPGHATRVRLEEDEPLSRELLRHVDDAPAPDAIAAPVAAVQEQSLMPGGDERAPLSPGASRSTPAPASQHADPLPHETVTMEPIEPGQLWIDAGHFNQPGYARRLAAELSGMVRQEGHGRSSVFLVRVGPFDLPAEADTALDQARSAGVTGARIIVE
jgi:rare lipoprotein A